MIGSYHQSGNHWTVLVNAYYIFHCISYFKLQGIKPEASSIIYIDPKGENATFVNQLATNWFILIMYAVTNYDYCRL